MNAKQQNEGRSEADSPQTTNAAAGREPVQPDRVPLTGRQADRLAQLTGVAVDDLRGQTIAAISDRFRWVIDPDLFLFRRICGQVVKTDPATGIDYPVPHATVYVEDTDCSFLGFFPVESPWSWLFPIHCTREVIGTTTTDECGHFCVWVPRFEIDWILRWRREWYCYWDLFVKPSIGDILPQLRPEPAAGPGGPGGPDPAPGFFKAGGPVLQHAEALLGRGTARKLALLENSTRFGGQTAQLRDLLARPAFSQPVPPPVPQQIREIHAQHGAQAVAAHLDIADERMAHLNLSRYVGPLLRCREIFVPEFVPILDVPDITFRVTQDVNGDGTPETIYSEGFFDVRWDAGAIPDVTLHASAIAVTSVACEVPHVTCEEPTIQFAGLMPLTAAYVDMTTGFALRPNRPHPHGLISEAPSNPANAPFTGTLQLYGCNQHAGAHYYRILYSYNGAVAVPFVNRDWYIYSLLNPTDPPTYIHPDAQGWYEILPNPGDWHPGHLLLDWPTTQYPDGRYTLHIQLADNAKNLILDSPHRVAIEVDNTAPTLQFLSLAWRVAGSGAWTYFPDLVCPVVHRPVGTAIEFRVAYQAAAAHLLRVDLGGNGCGGDTPQPVIPPTLVHPWSDPATPQVDGSGQSLNPYDHWHNGPTDNNVSRAAIFTLAGSAPQGAYGFDLAAASRAFNPAGGDNADPIHTDWYYDANSLNWNSAYLPVAVIDT